MESKTVKEGRKVRYTKKVLRDSLIELMRKKPITQITIKEICDLADIGRTTFYAHYNDQYDLLKNIQDETFAHFEEMHEFPFDVKPSQREVMAHGEKMADYIAQNKDSIQVLLSENGDISFQKRFVAKFVNNGKKAIKRIFKEPVDEKTERAYSVFFVHGTIALLQDWLKNDMDIPISEMTKIMFRLLDGVWR
ncbi:MAG: TetR family transcriptional regulator C-terminal domain-containing protein [Treponema sp.]|nr:TetR family transcriptional regulator C-terminal domain-containing protein [Treponema sp.]